jgi:hypothetical protein
MHGYAATWESSLESRPEIMVVYCSMLTNHALLILVTMIMVVYCSNIIARHPGKTNKRRQLNDQEETVQYSKHKIFFRWVFF